MIKIKLTETENSKLFKAATEEQDTMKSFLSAQEKYIKARQHRIDLYDMILASHKVDPNSIVPDSTTNLVDGVLEIPELPKHVEIKKPVNKKKGK